MASFKIKVAGEGLVAKAHRLADVGPTSGSSVIYEILNCPDNVTVEDVCAKFKGFQPVAHEYEIEYSRLG